MISETAHREALEASASLVQAASWRTKCRTCLHRMRGSAEPKCGTSPSAGSKFRLKLLVHINRIVELEQHKS